MMHAKLNLKSIAIASIDLGFRENRELNGHVKVI